MKIHVLQHVPFEGPAAISDWAALHNYSLASSHLFAGAKLPSLSDFDLLVVMGGPMGVHDTSEYEWLKGEIAFVKSALDAGKKVLGVCLGAQIIAHALGGQVTKNPVREIGWFPVQCASNLPKPWSDFLPSEFVAFHWHGETFSLPTNAILLGSSAACVNQGFVWNKKALGLQFHLETTPASAEALIAHSANDLKGEGDYIQTPEQLRQKAKTNATALNRILVKLLDGFVAV